MRLQNFICIARFYRFYTNKNVFSIEIIRPFSVDDRTGKIYSGLEAHGVFDGEIFSLESCAPVLAILRPRTSTFNSFSSKELIDSTELQANIMNLFQIMFVIELVLKTQ